jgi:GT2 family glycosyltransferase
VSSLAGRVGVAIATADRRERLLATLARLVALRERPPVVVADNGSRDGTPGAVRAAFPGVEVVELGENRGAAARTEAVRRLGTPYVALCDDDSWWAPGALTLAAAILDAHPLLAVLQAQVLVGPDERLDPACAAMARSPLPPRRGPGPGLLGFVACGAVVRASAYLAAGGFHPRFGIGGEERLLALDLAAAGWELAYVPEVVAHHWPGTTAPRNGRPAREARNDLWAAWLRRPLPGALTETRRVLRDAIARPDVRPGIAEAASGLGWVARERRTVPQRVERAMRRLETQP